jgi:2-oxoglutarate ferredoxin oxidoreductase subunit alpha
VLVAELNDQGFYGYGQLAALLRARYCDPRIRGLNKTDGLTFKVKEILAAVNSQLAASSGGAASPL